MVIIMVGNLDQEPIGWQPHPKSSQDVVIAEPVVVQLLVVQPLVVGPALLLLAVVPKNRF